jgi:hypothetical protein
VIFTKPGVVGGPLASLLAQGIGNCECFHYRLPGVRVRTHWAGRSLNTADDGGVGTTGRVQVFDLASLSGRSPKESKPIAVSLFF